MTYEVTGLQIRLVCEIDDRSIRTILLTRSLRLSTILDRVRRRFWPSVAKMPSENWSRNNRSISGQLDDQGRAMEPRSQT
jgi:hypothetical protein